jgi:DNA-directed RNA polymerase subunit RPC12/RpoP
MGTETIQTQHGDVEIETEECASCGQKMLSENALPFEIEYSDQSTGHGYACQHCAEDGPMDFPSAGYIEEDTSMVFMILFAAPELLGEMAAGNELNDAGKSALAATLSTIIWMLAIYGTYLYLKGGVPI